MKRIIKLALVYWILSVSVIAQTVSFDEKVREIDEYAKNVVQTWAGKSGVGMAIAIVSDDKVVSAKGYGLRELGKTDSVDADTVFAIASNSKAFTTAALAILVDEKKLDWDDKVSKYLPAFQMYDPWVTSELTIRDLVTHRVGLDTFSGDLLWYETTYTPDEILERVRHLQTCFQLSNEVWLSKPNVHCRRKGSRKGLRKVMVRIRNRTNSTAARNVENNLQHQKPARERRLAAQRIGRNLAKASPRQCRRFICRGGVKFVGKRSLEMGQNPVGRWKI